MAALTAHKPDRLVESDQFIRRKNMDVAASTTIYNGAVVSKDASGYAVNAANTLFFADIARDGYANTPAAVTTDAPLVVESGQVEELTFDGAITIADIGKAVWLSDSGTVTLTNPATIAQAQVGILVAVTTSPKGMVDTSKAVSA